MKGVVFTEFSDMVESRFGLACLETIIEESKVPSKGVYTSVGTYNHQEMVALVVALSKDQDIPIPDLLEDFGTYLFHRFTELYPHFFRPNTHLFDFLEGVEHYIHVEVLKLYPDAELPRFTCARESEKRLIMTYQSDKSMANLAVGLIKGALDFMHQTGSVETIQKNANGTIVDLVITLTDG